MQALTSHAYPWIRSQLERLEGNYCEIGVFRGQGLEYLAQSLPNRKFWGIDPFIEDGHTQGHSQVAPGQQMQSVKDQCLARLEPLTNVQLLIMPSERVLANTDLCSRLEAISLVYIEGDHHYLQVLQDSQLAMNLLGPQGGWILFDDLGVPGVDQALEEFQQTLGTRCQEREYLGSVALALRISPE